MAPTLLQLSRTPPVAAVMSTREGRRGKRGTKEQGKIFQMKEENENISLNFYLQVLVLVKAVMQIQLRKYYRTAHPFFLTFSSNFLSCDSCVFISDNLQTMSCCIYKYIQKQALRVVPQKSCSVRYNPNR